MWHASGRRATWNFIADGKRDFAPEISPLFQETNFKEAITERAQKGYNLRIWKPDRQGNRQYFKYSYQQLKKSRQIRKSWDVGCEQVHFAFLRGRNEGDTWSRYYVWSSREWQINLPCWRLWSQGHSDGGIRLHSPLPGQTMCVLSHHRPAHKHGFDTTVPVNTPACLHTACCLRAGAKPETCRLARKIPPTPRTAWDAFCCIRASAILLIWRPS